MPLGGLVLVMEYEIESNESISHAVLTIVSRVENTAINDLPPLYESIEPDALDTILVNQHNIRLSFAYSNSLIEIYNGEYLTAKTT